MAEELKPCPFCGKPNGIMKAHGVYQSCCSDSSCPILKTYDTKDEAIEACNNRPIEDELKARIKFIEEHNKFYLNQVADLHKMIDDVRHENKELEKQLTWQPIDTAPIDIEILVYYNHFITDSPLKTMVYKRGNKFFVVGTAESFAIPNPTHWMPIPEFGNH